MRACSPLARFEAVHGSAAAQEAATNQRQAAPAESRTRRCRAQSTVLELLLTAPGVVGTALDKAAVPGDARLVSRLVANLADNAIRHNITGGHVAVKLAASTTRATLTVTNTRAVVPPLQAGRLLEPFQRAAPDRTTSPGGLGLGLSIVADIAKAHGADLEVRPQPEGGLAVTVSFPAWEGPADRADGGSSPEGCEIDRASGNSRLAI